MNTYCGDSGYSDWELEHSGSYQHRLPTKNTADDNLPKPQHKLRIKPKKDREAHIKNDDHGEGRNAEAAPDSYCFFKQMTL